MHLIEIDTNSLEALDDSVATLTPTQASKITIHPGDCNLVIPALAASGCIDTDKPCFALLDQDSTQLDWRTIETLAAMKTYEPPPTLSGRPKKCKTELWILFNSHQAVYRLWPSDRRDDRLPPGAGALDRMFGERSAWHDLWQDARPPSSLVLRYSDRLRDLDYQYVHPQLINDPTTGRPQHYMIHATGSVSGISHVGGLRASYARGAVSGWAHNTGDSVGRNAGGSIAASYATGGTEHQQVKTDWIAGKITNAQFLQLVRI